MLENPVESFLASLAQAVEAGTFVKLVLSKPRVAESDLVRVSARTLVLKDQVCLSFLHTHKTRDITKNLSPADGVPAVRAWLAETFGHAHLFATTETLQLMTSRKGKQTLLRGKVKQPAQQDGPSDAAPDTTPAAHDREKQRHIQLDRPFLTALGVTNAQHQLIPAMARKWKQINKFIEVLDHALSATALKRAVQLNVLDFGSGKGYLTFAMHEHLRHTLGLPARVTGVELRADMVALGNAAAQRLGLAPDLNPDSAGTAGLRFVHGDIRSHAPRPVDIMVALHACDTATDHAIGAGVRAGAQIIMCSPCCHKELRPQLLSPHPLRPILKHGVHLGQQAEMLTDGLRAMLLDACGYETQVFEFIALEHTNKNKMILAVKRSQAEGTATKRAAVWQQIDAIKSFYGIREQCLETLLKARLDLAIMRRPPL